MADLAEIKRVAEEAARRSLGATPIADVAVEEELGMEGDDLLRVRVVVADRWVRTIDADQFLAAVLSVKEAVRSAGDDRRALVGFITPAEVEQLADPES